MKTIKIAAAIIIAVVSFLISKLVADKIIVFNQEWGGWVVNLFILSPLYVIVFSVLLGVIGFGTWNLLSYFLKWREVKDAPPVTSVEIEKPRYSKPSPAPFILHTFLGTMFLVGCAVVVIFIGASFFKGLGDQAAKSMQLKYEKTYTATYPNTSFNDEAENKLAAEVEKTDARMVFYQREIEKATRDFIEADNAYGVFEADVKREFALSCMIKILTETMGKKFVSFHQVSGYKRNARNEYVNATNSKGRSMNNEALVKKNSSLYSYPLASGYGSYMLDHDFPDRCSKKMSVDSMYEKYLPIYLEAKENYMKKRLASARKEDHSYVRLTKYADEVFIWIDTVNKRKSVN